MSVSSFLENDIFMSYAHLDNETLTEDEKGWVSAFDNALQKRVSQLIGRKADIWRDRKLHGNDIFGDEIVDQFPKLKVFVSIVSPRYLKSEWCLKELKEFHKVANKTGGVRLGNKSRIFKVIKTPVPPDEYPAEISRVLGYEFFYADEKGRFREFVLEKGSPTYYQFIERFEDVAQDICQLIKALDERPEPPKESGKETAAVDKEKIVYLANTTSDLNPARDNIRRDLEMRSYTVLPDQELPTDARFRKTVEDYLGHSSLAIHLIGDKYGLIPEDEQLSVVELQHELSRTASLKRLIWMPKFDMSNEDHRQQHFITDLRDNAVADTNTELLSGNLEDLKTVIVDTLEKQSSLGDHSPPVIEETAIVRIYLMFDKLDRETVSLIDDYLYDQEFEVLRPIFEGQELDIRQVHQDNLKLCDGVFIYCNQASESWLNFKMSDVRKAPGYRNGKPLKAAAIYLCGDPNRFKKDFRTREVSAVIKQFGTFSKADLAPFIKTLRGDESVIK
jgi:hypothetical protein